jgi:thymidylate synthase (FAD)
MTARLISVSDNAEKLMAYCARVSSPNQEKEEIAGLLRYCAKHGHWSIFEMANMVVEIDTSRGISPQILRHRSFSFQEFSQRYAAVDDSGVKIYAARRQDNKNRQNSIDDLSDEVKAEWEARQLLNWKVSFEHYQWALDNGIAKECARFVLPLGCGTKLYMQGTVRSWIHYLQLRTGHGTQKEHMDIALDIKKIFIDVFPQTSKALEWS